MKQTAVEWLVEQICGDHINEWKKEIEQAKQMEKEQIVESWDNGFANGYDLGKHDDDPKPDDAEQYYNETFKSEIITDINLDENDIKKINDYVKNETFKSE